MDKATALTFEFCTLIIPKADLENCLDGGVERYFWDICDSQGSYLEDEHLTRVSYMASNYALEALARIESLVSLDDFRVAIIGGLSDFEESDWLEHGIIDGCSACWLTGTNPGLLRSIPEGIGRRGLDIHFEDFCERLKNQGLTFELSDNLAVGNAVIRGQSLSVHALVHVEGQRLRAMMTFNPSSRKPWQFEPLQEQIRDLVDELAQ